jgi:hypothetical protein
MPRTSQNGVFKYRIGPVFGWPLYVLTKFSIFQIVLNNLLEDQIAEERVNKKDKAGNGLKCKNRPKINPVETISFPGETSSFNLEADLQPGPSGATSRVESQLDMARKVKLEKVIFIEDC